MPVFHVVMQLLPFLIHQWALAPVGNATGALRQ